MHKVLCSNPISHRVGEIIHFSLGGGMFNPRLGMISMAFSSGCQPGQRCLSIKIEATFSTTSRPYRRARQPFPASRSATLVSGDVHGIVEREGRRRKRKHREENVLWDFEGAHKLVLNV